MTHGSLFSGIGGFDLAAEWAGWENMFHCEWNEFGKRVLNYYWPQAACYGDITKTDFTIWRGRIDILTGGFPCQPYSAAGKRLGKEDERHLWPEMLRAIREIQPRWVVGENVRGLTNWNGGLVFDEVQADLETLGYQVTPFLLPACGVNAPHRRDRIWFVAHSNNGNRQKIGFQTRGEINVDGIEGERTITDPHSSTKRTPGQSGSLESNGSANHDEQEQRREPTELDNVKRNDTQCNVTNTNSTALQTQGTEQQTAGIEQHGKLCNNATNPNGIGLRGESNRIGNAGQFNKASAEHNWENFPTQSPICNGDDGISERLDSITFPKWRAESIKAGGNAIVPELVYMIFKAINEYEQQHNQ